MQQNAEVININKKVQSMPSERGFVSLWRDIDKQPWYNDCESVALFIHIMIKASHKPRKVTFKGEDIHLSNGQLYTTRKQLSRELGLTDSKVFRALKKFESLNQISVKTVVKNKRPQGKIITLLGWEKWQKIEQPIEQLGEQPEAAVLKVVQANCEQLPEQPTEQLNNNVLNNNKDNTCQNSSEFSRVPMKEILSLFNKILPSLPQPKKITPARQKIVKARHFNDLNGKIENWERYFNYIKNNCTWMLEGKYNITFDYLTKQQNFVNIYEGARDDK